MKIFSIISIRIFLVISITGLFLPWFFFSWTEDYSNGFGCMNPGMMLGYLGSLGLCIIIPIKKDLENLELLNFLCLILIALSSLYEFFTWHIETVTGNLNLRVSIENAHYGFYISLISIVFSIAIYIYNLIKKRI